VTGLHRHGWLDPGLETDELITQTCQPTGEGRSRLTELVDELVPTLRPDRLLMPRAERPQHIGITDPHSVHGGHDCPHHGRVQARVGSTHVNPLVRPDLRAAHGGRTHSRPSSASLAASVRRRRRPLRETRWPAVRRPRWTGGTAPSPPIGRLSSPAARTTPACPRDRSVGKRRATAKGEGRDRQRHPPGHLSTPTRVVAASRAVPNGAIPLAGSGRCPKRPTLRQTGRNSRRRRLRDAAARRRTWEIPCRAALVGPPRCSSVPPC
jgi:hypothetical protein